ncbi:hypothetical protein RB595_008063 [Gaeumannomyces hyphopodioides]
MCHFGKTEPREVAADHKGRRPSKSHPAPEGPRPLTHAKDAIVARNYHSAARPETVSRPGAPRNTPRGDADKSRVGSGGRMPQSEDNKRHPRVWDCQVDNAPRRDLHSSEPCPGNTATPIQGEDYSGVWDDLDDFLAELELAQLRTNVTRLGVTLAGARGKLAARTAQGRTGANSAYEETTFF